MSPHGRVGTALLLVTVCMVRAYPQSPNQNAEGPDEFGQNQQHYASGERTSRSNMNAGPTIDHLSSPIQNFARNTRRQFPGQEFSNPSMPGVLRRSGNENRPPPPQQTHRTWHRSEYDRNSRQVLPQQTSNRPRDNHQDAHRTQHRSLPTQSRNIPNNNYDYQNRIEKSRTMTVSTNHERASPVSRTNANSPEMNHHFVNTQKVREELKLPPKPSMAPQTGRHTAMPVQGSNVTSVHEESLQKSFKMPRTTMRPSGLGESIVFPDQKLTVPRIGKDGPKCAHGLSYCEEIEGYPKEHISELIQKESHLYKSVFGSDVMVPETEVANRILPGEELCKYIEKIAYPKLGKTKDEKWAWIANTEEFQQGVRVEVCEDSGTECHLLSSTPLGYKTECKQKHIYRRLLSVSNDGSPSTEEFLFPSCCACTVKKERK